jgi:hypothetical protein
MNKSKLKSYAPQARLDFIAAVTARANLLGLSDKGGQLDVAPAHTQGDVTIISGRAWPVKVDTQRDRLISLMRRDGFQQTCEAVAYTWFNRFLALRYLELHDYLGHGYRALSSKVDGLPEILTYATDLANSESALPGLNIEAVTEMKLAGNRDGELYRMLLVAQCNALSQAMPFLFERIDDETELLLPENLLLSDSVIAKLVNEVAEEDWAQVEIIGWLYQFYISDKKDEVIGKVVKSEDIPAATQLFTPNWIVQYLVQNSVGRSWMMANPSSSIHTQWPYYIKPAEQDPEVNAQLEQLINTRIAEDGTTLNPESITVLDPACGSGHILVEAYETLKQIYLERGYQPRAIPRLILENNLYGIDIDDRAAQLAGFALLMKARADDRRILQEPPKLNVISLQESKGLNADDLAQSLIKFRINRNTIADLIDTFQHAKTFGSLIQVPAKLTNDLNALSEQCQQAIKSGDLFAKEAAQSLLPLITQARLLSKQYDAVIANPPYMGGKYLNPLLKEYLKKHFIGYEKDLFSAFVIRCSAFASKLGQVGIMSPNVWMYISSHEKLRNNLLKTKTLNNLVELPLSGFKGATVQICAYNFVNSNLNNFIGSYVRLVEFKGGDYEMASQTLEAIQNPECGWFYKTKPDDFKKIPGSPIAYWANKGVIASFENFSKISDSYLVRTGMQTGDNLRFVRYWHEISSNEINNPKPTYPANPKTWFLYSKGGEYRKWFGNVEHVVYWKNNGENIKNCIVNGSLRSRVRELTNYFSRAASWSFISSSYFGCRYKEPGVFFDVAGSCALENNNQIEDVLAFFCSNVASTLLSTLNPTLNFQIQDISNIPFLGNTQSSSISKTAIAISKSDWDAYETSWDFTNNPIIRSHQSSLAQSYNAWQTQNAFAVAEMKRLEEENNRIFIEAYGLQDELSPDVPDNQITLTRADREKDSQRLVSMLLAA